MVVDQGHRAGVEAGARVEVVVEVPAEAGVGVGRKLKRTIGKFNMTHYAKKSHKM